MIHGCASYHLFAFSTDHTFDWACVVEEKEKRKRNNTGKRNFLFTAFYLVEVIHQDHSPDGFLIFILILTGSPKLGEPSVFHVNFCMRGERLSPQPCEAEELA